MLSRVLSPSGFIVTGLLLLLPFVGVSCSDPELGTLDGSYTGFDLVTGGQPSYQADGPVGDMVAIEQVEFPDPGVRGLAILLLVLLLAGVGAALVPVVRVRVALGAVVAGVAGGVLVVTQIVAQSNLVTSMQELLLAKLFSVPQDLARVATEDYLAGATGSRVGFWVGLVVLVSVVALNVTLLVRARRMPRGAQRLG